MMSERELTPKAGKLVTMSTKLTPEGELFNELREATFRKTDPLGNEVEFIYLEKGSPRYKKVFELLAMLS